MQKEPVINNTRPGAITDLALGTYFMRRMGGVDPRKGIGMIYGNRSWTVTRRLVRQ